MKKLLLLLIIPLFLTGCYDYQELNNRAIIAGVAIDYEEDAFHIDLEILNNKKSSNQEEESSKTYYVKGSGPTLDKAFQDCHSRLSKEPYYSHLKILILGEEVAKEKLSEVLDYMIRDATIRNIFLPVHQWNILQYRCEVHQKPQRQRGLQTVQTHSLFLG